jgi:hypothetical protein
MGANNNEFRKIREDELKAQINKCEEVIDCYLRLGFLIGKSIEDEVEMLLLDKLFAVHQQKCELEEVLLIEKLFANMFVANEDDYQDERAIGQNKELANIIINSNHSRYSPFEDADKLDKVCDVDDLPFEKCVLKKFKQVQNKINKMKEIDL